MKVVSTGLTAAALLASPWLAQGATFRFASSSNRIYVEGGGSATLSAIKAALPNAPLDLVNTNGRIWLLRANLQIEDGSVVVLHGTAVGGDVNEFRLQSNNSSATNSVVSITADWGSLDIENTKILSWDSAANGPDVEFENFGRAFVRVRSSLAADGVTPQEARMDIVNSEISYLGYDAAESYGLSWKVTGTHPDPTKRIVDFVKVYGDITGSHIHHNYWGVYSFGLKGGQWLNNEVNNNAGYGFDPHDDSDNLRIEGNRVHHNGGIGRGTHGIIASMYCDHLVIRNNRSWANAENGIMLHRHSDDAIIEGNVTFLNGDSGIAIFDSDRATVRNNIILSNANAGVRFSVGCTANVIINNEIGYSGENGLLFVLGTDPPEPDPVDPALNNRNRRNTVASNTVHHCTAEGIRMVDGDTNSFIGNSFSANGPELSFETSRQTRFISNSIPSTVTVDLIGSTSVPSTTFFKQQPLLKLALANTSASATFEDDGGAIFDFDQTTVATRVDNQHSFITLTTALIGTGTTVVTRNFLVTLNTGEAQVNPTLWELTGALRKQWTSQATAAAASIQYRVGDLSPNTPYAIQKNGQPLSTVNSDSGGRVTFTDTPGTTSAIQFAIAASGQPPTLPTVTVTASDASAAESGPNPGTFTVSRIGGSTNALTVRYAPSGTASSGSDYTALSGTIVIPAGSSSANVTVNPIDDTAVESSETVVLTLSTDAAYLVGSPNSATVTIADNDQSPTLSAVTVAATDANAAESGLNPGTFTVRRAGGPTNALTVRYSLSGTASNGVDYAALSGSVIIPAGGAAAAVTVNPVDDALVEGNETVVLTISSDPAYVFGTNIVSTVTIADNDQSPTLPAVTAGATDANAAESGPNPGTFTVSRTGATTNALTVRYSLSGTASNGSDYTALSGSVLIPIGSAAAAVAVNPVDDVAVEGNETVVLTLSSDPAYLFGTNTVATVTIADNDQPPTLATVTVGATDASAAETGPEPGTFTVRRTGAATNALTVRYSLSGTASNGLDYAALSGSVVIPTGSGSAAVAVNPIDDVVVEGNETVVLRLSSDPAYFVGTTSNSATVTIADNDQAPTLPTVTVAVSDAGASESGPDPGTFTISRIGETANALIVTCSLSGTASNGLDYAALSDSIIIPAGSASVDVAVEPIDDAVGEGNETVVITLSAGAAYTVGSANSATVTIADNDQPTGATVVSVVATDDSASETKRNPGTFTISRTGGGPALTVRYEVSGTASNGSDYATLSGSVSIRKGGASAKVRISPINDTAAEGDETVVLALLPDTAYAIGSPNSAVVTITDNDQPATPAVVSIVASDPTASESGAASGAFTFVKIGGSDAPLTVTYSIGGTASNGVDYAALSGRVTFGRRKTSASVSVNPIADSALEGNETVVLTLVAGTSYTVGSPDSATVTISDTAQTGLASEMSAAPVITVVPQVLSTAGQGNGRLAFAWDGVAGQRYQLQYKSDLNATQWIDLGGVITTTSRGTVVTFDDVGSEPQRFYRVVLVP